jgi:hypothetical protein
MEKGGRRGGGWGMTSTLNIWEKILLIRHIFREEMLKLPYLDYYILAVANT